MPSSKASVKFALTNTTNALLSVTARLTRSPHITNDPQVFELQPRETRLLDLCSDFAAGENAQYSEALALSLEHSGTKEALLARAFISEVERGYSNVAQFSNPTLGKSKTYHGAGLRLGTIAGERLVPVAVVRNTNHQPTSLNVRVPYTRTDGTTGIVILPRTRLQPNGIKILDMRQVVRRGEAEPIQIAGLEIEYDSPAGSVMVSAHSESMNRNQVFRVPMWDVLAQRSPTGGYPWHIEETSTTKAYIKNATDREQDYVAFLLYENSSRYMLGTKTVAPHQTIEIDVETLRNNQVPDVFGITIPLHVSSGQLQWTLSRRHDPERGEDEFDRLALVGRSEQIDVTKGISSNYACQNCCGGTFLNGRIEPDDVEFTAEDVVQFQAYRVGQTCYEDGYPIPYSPTNWESTNPAVVSIGSNTGIATMHGIGVAKIKASWQEERSFETDPCEGGGYLTDETRAISETPLETKRIERLLPDCGSCFSFNITTSPEADLSVKPKVTVTQAGFTGDYLINRWTDGVAIDSPDGSSPTWRQINNPNSPVAYAKGSNPTIFATFSINPSAPSTNAKIRAKKGSTVIATKDVTIVGDSVSINGITTTSASEATVKSTSPTLLWEISYDNGSHWSSMGVSGPHTMYWTYAAPLGPPFQDDSGFTYSALYDLALQKACGYANGASALGTIVGSVNNGVDNETLYNPGESIATLHPLSGYTSSGANGIQCSDESNLLRGLLRSIGIDGTVLFIWAGPNASTLTSYRIGTTGYTFPSFRLIRNAHDAAPSNPHFKFHAVVSANGTWYDPSYGLSYSSLSFNETANNNTPQQIHSSSWTFLSTSSFTCTHTGIGGNQP